jgi:predicted TIM-barrel fold metal-dependent hydrolase
MEGTMALSDLFVNGGGCPIIDSHGHLGPFNGIFMPEAPLEKMIAGMDRDNIESIIISPHSALAGDTREGNREMLDAVQRHPGRVYGYCTINPNFVQDIEGEMNACLGRPGVVGMKVHPSMHAYPVDGENYRPVWERAHSEKWMVLSHTWGADGGCGANDMRKVAERYPDVRLILGHSCYGAFDKAIRLAADFPNVYLELTAAYHVYGLIEWMCRDAGSEKVLFGTDYPWFDPMVAAGCVVFAHIETREMRNILYNNARRLIDEQAARWK